MLGVRAYSLQRKTNRDVENQAAEGEVSGEIAGAVAMRPEDKRPSEPQDGTEDLQLIGGPNAYEYTFDSVKAIITYLYNVFDYLRTLVRTF